VNTPITSKPEATTSGIAIAPLLAFAAGFTDTVGFLSLFGLFTAHVTGNFIVLGALLVQGQHGLIAKALALPVFILAVAAARLVEGVRSRQGKSGERLLLTIQIVFLFAFLAAGVAAFPVHDPDAPRAILAGLLGVAAMGVQNAASRIVFASLSPTTVMTGNVTQLTIDAIDLLTHRDSDAGATLVARMRKMAPPVIAFTVGAGTGGVSFVALGFWCLLVPIGAVAAVMAIRRKRPA
jgi:uncharacterized membrane protein YoaK (UPF0700 family)